MKPTTLSLVVQGLPLVLAAFGTVFLLMAHPGILAAFRARLYSSSHPTRSAAPVKTARPPLQLGTRPAWLVSAMRPSALRDALFSCVMDPSLSSAAPSSLSISHRGAPLQYPEHTREGYTAAAMMGAGWMECDVVFTKDKELVCRHSQCDLHTTTDILLTPLAVKCSRRFTPAAADGSAPADALCCTSHLTLEEFRTLRGKMDGFEPAARTPEQYVGGTKSWRTDLYASRGTLVTHAESILMFAAFGARFTPELKLPLVSMPYDGMTQEALAQKLIDEYVAADIDLADVRPQSKHQPDVMYWLRAAPKTTPVLLDERYELSTLEQLPVEEWPGDGFGQLYDAGLRIIAPPMWMLVRSRADGKIIPSKYAVAARTAGLDIVTWTLERSGPVGPDMELGEYYYQSVRESVYGDGTTMELLDVLVRDVGVVGVFSDWPATVSLYAACFGY
jgi:glycerophosphoryl diester phosphodiesterase